MFIKGKHTKKGKQTQTEIYRVGDQCYYKTTIMRLLSMNHDVVSRKFENLEDSVKNNKDTAEEKQKMVKIIQYH